MLILRPVSTRDLDELVALAAQLDSMNLPSDRDFLARRIETSLASFAGRCRDWREGVYVFVMEDLTEHRCVGTSTIIAKHGTPESPHYWLELSNEERNSADLDRRFAHTKLRLRSSSDGPTEIGGLILDPQYRRHPEKCGKALSIARFAYIAAHPERFEREVIAEMLSAFEEGLFVFTAGAEPTRIRLLLPVNVTDLELEEGFAILEKALRRVAADRGLPC